MLAILFKHKAEKTGLEFITHEICIKLGVPLYTAMEKGVEPNDKSLAVILTMYNINRI